MEWFEEVMEARKKRYWEHERAFYTHPSEFSVEPFRLADGLWYVGDRMVCGHMIETKDGLIRISARSYPGGHEVNVTDNGPGYDPAASAAEPASSASAASEGNHIGINNVRERLWRLCGGELLIDSAPGKGTTAVIRIPDNGSALG